MWRWMKVPWFFLFVRGSCFNLSVTASPPNMLGGSVASHRMHAGNMQFSGNSAFSFVAVSSFSRRVLPPPPIYWLNLFCSCLRNILSSDEADWTQIYLSPLRKVYDKTWIKDVRLDEYFHYHLNCPCIVYSK